MPTALPSAWRATLRSNKSKLLRSESACCLGKEARCVGDWRISTTRQSRKNYRRLLPGYVRRFVERAAPLLDLCIEGDLGATFALVPDRPPRGRCLVARA